MVLKHTPLGEINLPFVASSANAPRCRRNRRSFRVGSELRWSGDVLGVCRLQKKYFIALQMSVLLQSYLQLFAVICSWLQLFAVSRRQRGECSIFAMSTVND